MLSRVMPSVRELSMMLTSVLVTLLMLNLVRPADAGVATTGPTTDVVFVATGENFPDALGAAAAAGALLAPVLLVTQNSVPQATLDQLNDLEPQEIIIVGGTAVISEGVKSTLEGLGFGPTVTRVSGANRYETAAELSGAVFPTRGYYPLAAYSAGGQFETVTAGDEVVRSVTLTAPVDGTVIVTSTAGASESTAGDEVRCSITTGTLIDTTFLQLFESPGASGDFEQLAGTRGFGVVAGQVFTANLVCDHNGASGSSSILDSVMTAIFVADI